MIANRNNISVDIVDGVATIIVQSGDTSDAMKLEKMTGEIVVSFKPSRRSLDQNGYMWSLLGQMSKAAGTTPSELYQEFIRRSGFYNIVPIRNDAVEAFCRQWESLNKDGHCGWMAEVLGKSKLDGFTNIKAYPGSSSFTQAEMERFISSIEDEAKVFGVKILTKEERKKLVR